MIKNKLKLIGLASLTTILLSGCGEVAKGSKIGQVVKVNEASGLFCKTVEVEIIRGGFNSGSGAQGGSLHFTIENNQKNVELVKQAMLDGSEIEVNYRTEFATFCRSDSQNTFGDEVKLVKSTVSHIQPDSGDITTELLKALKLQNEAIQKLINH
jgi:hypothetical protein